MTAHIVFFCPNCHAETDETFSQCPQCGTDINAWRRRPYGERLRTALHHPLSEVRMGAIISLSLRRELDAAIPLAQCALAYPTDIVQALEVVQALTQLPISIERTEALHLLQGHPIRAVAQRAKELLVAAL